MYSFTIMLLSLCCCYDSLFLLLIVFAYQCCDSLVLSLLVFAFFFHFHFAFALFLSKWILGARRTAAPVMRGPAASSWLRHHGDDCRVSTAASGRFTERSAFHVRGSRFRPHGCAAALAAVWPHQRTPRGSVVAAHGLAVRKPEPRRCGEKNARVPNRLEKMKGLGRVKPTRPSNTKP